MTLFGFGTATIDIRISTADFGPEYRAKLLARETRFFGGGAVSNALYQASLLGTETQWLGKLGRDRLGGMIEADLKECGIGTDYIVREPDALSPFNLAVYAGEDNRRVGGYLLPNCLAELTSADLERFGGVPGKEDWCLAEVGEIPLPRVLDFCRRIRERGVRIALDIDLDPLVQCTGGSRKMFTALLTLAEVVMPNLDSVASIYGSHDPENVTAAVYADCGRPVVTTAGAAGAFFTENGDALQHVPAPEAEAVDTVGAGDAFHGGFLWARMNGNSLLDAVKTGAVCGAANCEAFGARSGMLNADGLRKRR